MFVTDVSQLRNSTATSDMSVIGKAFEELLMMAV